jgi:hypothetical protein
VTGDQLAAFERFLAAARGLGIEARWVSVANTAATLLHPRSHHRLVRPGIGIYGLSPDLGVDAADHGLRPALSLVSQVSFAKRVPAGTAVSYGHRWSSAGRRVGRDRAGRVRRRGPPPADRVRRGAARREPAAVRRDGHDGPAAAVVRRRRAARR